METATRTYKVVIQRDPGGGPFWWYAIYKPGARDMCYPFCESEHDALVLGPKVLAVLLARRAARRVAQGRPGPEVWTYEAEVPEP